MLCDQLLVLFLSYLYQVVSSGWSSEMLCLAQSQMPRMVLLEMQRYYCVKTALRFAIRFPLAGIRSVLPLVFFSVSTSEMCSTGGL